MYLITGKKIECTGCRACADICPKGCITYVEDDERFIYPIIDSLKCINCQLCQNVCPMGTDIFNNACDSKVIVAKHNSEEVVFKSSSGGAFTALYQSLLKMNYVVYGVKWTHDFQVIHDMARTESECEKFRKSKYIFSDVNHSYTKIEKQLKRGEKVCFVGTPCQCAALKAFLNTKKVCIDELLLIDIICHGAPNQAIFNQYLDEKINQDKVDVYQYNFKNKIPICGEINSRTVQLLDSKGESQLLSTRNDPFLKGYYGRLFYRPSCEFCRYARPERVTDVTIGDAWHIEELFPEWNSLEGVSLVLFNTARGKLLIPDIEKYMDVKDVTLDWAVNNNAQLRIPTNSHPGRDKFFRLIKVYTFEQAVDMSMKVSFFRKVIYKIKKYMKIGIKKYN